MRVKGKVTANTFNKQGYTIPEEELIKAALTLVGKPVKLGFEGETIGHIIKAEFTDGEVIYEADFALGVEAEVRDIEEKTIRCINVTGVSILCNKEVKDE